MLMRTGAGMRWNDDGSLDGSSIVSGGRAQHDLLIPEILRREAERLMPAPADASAEHSDK